MGSFLRGLLALAIVSAILLVSDLNNRVVKVSPKTLVSLESEAVKGRSYKLGLCYFAPEASHDDLLKGLWKRLTELGYVQGENLLVTAVHANGEIGLIPSVLQSLDNQDLDLILATSTPCITASLNAVKKHRVAFTYCSDPLAAGVGESYEKHSPGITGIGSFPPVSKTIDFITDLKKGIKKIGTIYNSSEANSRSVISLARQLVAERKIELLEAPVTSTSEVLQAVQACISRGSEVMYISGDNTAIQAFDVISDLCSRNKIPVVVNDLPLVSNGAIAAIGPGWEGIGYHSGDLVGKMLNGISPDTIPLENYTDENVLVDTTRARLLGLKIPEKYLSSPVTEKPGEKLKLALVHFVDTPNSEDCEKGIRKALSDNNLNEGSDFSMKVYNAQGDISTLNSIAGTLAGEKWDLVFCLSTPTLQALMQKLPRQKIVFTNVGDPVTAGAGKSFTDHLPDVCGVATMSDFDGLLRFALTIQLRIKVVGTVFTPAEVNSVIFRDKLEEAAAKAGIKLIAAPASGAADVVESARSLVMKRIDAFCQISDNLTGSTGSAIVKVARDNKIPYYSFTSPPVKQGALAACARDYMTAGYESGIMATEVLKGKNPADIPFTVVSKTNYIINEKAAEFFGVKLPANLIKSFPGTQFISVDTDKK